MVIGNVRFAGQGSHDNHPAEGRSTLVDDRLDEIELGGEEGSAGASDTEAAQAGNRHAVSMKEEVRQIFPHRSMRKQT
jgi:hypothetical protein